VAIVFVRHGENEANKQERMTFLAPGAALTDLGLRQAEELADALSTRAVTAIYTSPLLRAAQTARVLADRRGLEPAVRAGLAELAVPELEGSPLAEGLAALAPAWHAWVVAGDLTFRPFPRSESGAEVLTRFRAVVDGIAEAHPRAAHDDGGEDVLVVGHGGLLQLCLPVACANLGNRYGCDKPLHNCAMVVTRFVRDDLVCAAWDGHEVAAVRR
jgi:broad specificity phosphatase PhoE